MQYLRECPICHSIDENKMQGLVIEYQTRDGSEAAGCTVCGYGWQSLLVKKCSRCGLDFNTLVSSIDDAFWMLEGGDSVKACPVCGCTYMVREYTEYAVGAKWLAIPIGELHPMSELSGKC